ncbi:GDSL-like Lipase/Acylhydrolase [Maioricimonas rarisocia]|uniref:GDSL-like Lipase/Acylhydrolase n=1 Tax=Maioricimonas rarisocia TaxID=2528026 RepID=A0A517Z6L0_9PLAN|nr:SGNH/GDSL hydrolase family protein [Maioricimonas rarisocia]QDU38132.1 GDSL-like Lipase/Acylhydrolase [Maioricimonas rarisocia]
MRAAASLFAACLLLTAPAGVHADDDPASAEQARILRWESAIQKFEQADRDEPPAAGGVLFVGSSSIRLWDLEKSFPGLDAINRGFGGSHTADAVHYFDRIVAPHKPRVIAMYAGDNDIAGNKPPCQVLDDFRQFVSKVEETLPGTKVVYIAIKPSLKRWNLVHKMRAANALIEAECVEKDHLEYVDIDAPMLGEDGMPREELFANDGLHLSPAGYELWTELVRPHLSVETVSTGAN